MWSTRYSCQVLIKKPAFSRHIFEKFSVNKEGQIWRRKQMFFQFCERAWKHTKVIYRQNAEFLNWRVGGGIAQEGGHCTGRRLHCTERGGIAQEDIFKYFCLILRSVNLCTCVLYVSIKHRLKRSYPEFIFVSFFKALIYVLVFYTLA